MLHVWEWLLGLDGIRLAEDAPLYVRWGQKPEGWMLLLLAVAAVVMIAMIQRAERVSLARRSVLILCRCATLAVVITLMFEPMIVLERNREEPSHVTLLIDRSASMATTDGASPDDSRIAKVVTGLTRDEAAPLRRLLAANDVELASFADRLSTHGLATKPEDVSFLRDWLGEIRADTQGTNLAESIGEVLRRSQGRRLAGIVLASDGQATSAGGMGPVLAELQRRQVPVYPIRIGSPIPPRDVAIGTIRVPRHVYAGDAFAVEVPLSADGITQPTTVTIELADELTGAAMARSEVHLDVDSATAVARLHVRAQGTGQLRYLVRAIPLDGERAAHNNAAQVETTVLDDQLHVLYVEGYPRYEYRYLKNALLREPTISLSVLLIEADERFVQEGTEPIRHFPRTPDELGRFDVVIFGDVDPRGDWLSHVQANMLLDFVGNQGGGFALIAGARAAPHRFLRTPLSKLIPVRIDPTFLGRYESTLTEGFHPVVTSDGIRMGLFDTAFDESGEASQSTLILSPDARTQRPELYWIARSLGPRPGAVVLAEHPVMRAIPEPGAAAAAMPVAVVSQYGAGRIFFQATDDTWRWRRQRVGGRPAGELIHDTYWVRLVRMLARPSHSDDRRGYELTTDRPSYAYGTPIHVRLNVLDTQLLGQLGDAVGLLLTGETKLSKTDAEAAATSRFRAFRTAPSARTYEGVCTAARPGCYDITLPPTSALRITDAPGTPQPRVSVTVRPMAVESHHLEADHNQLERLARATGGRVLATDELAAGFEAILNRSAEIPDDVVEPLWDSKLAIILFLGLITTEWITRKAFGLL